LQPPRQPGSASPNRTVFPDNVVIADWGDTNNIDRLLTGCVDFSGRALMRKLPFSSLMVLPPVALLVGLLVCFDAFHIGVESHRAFFMIWSMATFACWVLTVVMAGGMIKGREWLLRPLGVLAICVTTAAGLAGLLLGSAALFGVVFAVTVAASVVAVRAATNGTPRHQAFCWAFGVCMWVGAAFTLIAPAPFTGTPNIQVIWWSATGWGNGLSIDAVSHFVVASHYAIILLFLTWFLAFTGGWLLGQFAFLREYFANKPVGHD
jgi:hypothetical protein